MYYCFWCGVLIPIPEEAVWEDEHVYCDVLCADGKEVVNLGTSHNPDASLTGRESLRTRSQSTPQLKSS